MEQEKINNIFKQDILALKNVCLNQQAATKELAAETQRIAKAAQQAVNNLQFEIEEWKKIIRSFQKYERYKVENVLSAKEDWEKATNPDDVRIHPGGGGGGKGGWGQNGN
jgi:hypothetical protein